MNYKETLFFVGKCLTITHEEHNRIIIEKEIKSGNVNWDNVVKLSTAHYVFPALYCNLKRADFLHYLPKDLVEYMKHITDLNRERNQQIINQVKEINELLLANNITPIFLKGTGNLLEGLYEDIAERMVGDIDFLVSYEEFEKSVKLLKSNNYKKTSDKLTSPILSKHYPRLFHQNKTAAVEIHIEMVKHKHSLFFNYNKIKEDILYQKNFGFLGRNDQLILSILANQVNDYGRYYKSINLRNTYDIYLQSKHITNLTSYNSYKNFSSILNSYLMASAKVLNSNKIMYINNLKSKTYFKILVTKLKHPLFGKLHSSFWKFEIYTHQKLLGAIRFVSNKEFRKYYIKKLSNS